MPHSHKLGFLRFWQVYFGSVVALRLVQLLFFSREKVVFEFSDYLVLCDVVFAGVVAWLIMGRKRVTRPFVCVYCPLMFVVEIVSDIVLFDANSLVIVAIAFSRVVFLSAAVYFFFSRKARTKLTRPFNVREGRALAREDERLYRLFNLAFWRDVASFFMVSSVLGHWMERAYGVFVRYFLGYYDPTSPLWQDFLVPFNIYGMGMTLCILVLFPLKDFLARKLENIWLVLLMSYVANTVVCTALELVMGLLVNHPDATGHLTKWDYSDMPFNFMGQICLQNALLFGLIATLVVWYVFPVIERLILQCPRDTANLIFVIILITYLSLAAFYLIDPPVLPDLWRLRVPPILPFA
ncbi:MAG: putative ABC transporter permease [Coriobacteriales bacterium]|jgi:uncharacterized membrane protein|nr:putative ABC transporter permease [Coriobacteriales bacterium]